MSIRATVVGQITVTETVAAGIDGVTDPTLVYNAFNFSHTVNASTTITGTKVTADTSALSAGAATIDLTAVPVAGGTTQSFSGLKVRGYLFSTPTTNAANITIAEGASNGYPLGDSIVLKPGQRVVKWLDDEGTTVAGGDKTLDLAGTGTDAFSYLIIAG
jgi:hypothetical protein